MGSDHIVLTGITAVGKHGVFDFEQQNGQKFVVDLAVEIPLDDSDDLSHSVDYAQLAADVVTLIEGPAVKLIETLANRIAQRVLSYNGVRSVEVAVHKPQAPINVAFADVAVKIARRKL